MATSTFSVTLNNTSTIKAIHNALITLGLVQTSDTGQLNLTTAPAANSTANYSFGYTVYRWNDDYQATYPIFLRIDWTNYNKTDGSKNIGITVGEGTNGAGAITGKTITSTGGSTSGSGTAATAYMSLVDGSLALFIASNFYISVERLRNIDGSKVNGFYVQRMYASGIYTEEYFVSPLQTAAVTFGSVKQYFFPYHSWAIQPLTAVGTDVPFIPKTIVDPAGRTLLGNIAVPTTEVPFNYDFTVSRFGVNRTFKSLGTSLAANIIGATGAPANAICVAIPWE